MPRTYVRKFDHDEARARYAAGESQSALARAYGVSTTRISQVVNPEVGRKSRENHNKWIRQARCPDCGAQTTRLRLGGDSRCKRCAAIAAATSVRESELQCVSCREWKLDEDFPFNRHNGTRARRSRHTQCRACQTKSKRAWRQRNPDYEREYTRRRRAKTA